MWFLRMFMGLLTLTVIGCASATTELDNGLVSTVQLDRSEFRVGDSVKVTITVENRGTSTTNVNTDACMYVFVVLASNGKEVGPSTTGRDCFPFARLEPLAPGSHIVFADYWNGSVISQTGTAGMVAPGRYVIRGRITGVIVPHNDSALVRVL